MTLKTYTLTLDWAKMLSPSVRHLAFKCDDEALFNFIPGQFITIHFKVNDQLLRRSYSIAAIPDKNKPCIEIAAGFVDNGPGTNLLFSLQPGDQINAAGPFGRLVLRDEQPKRLIMMATSTGVTPYRAMLPELKRRLACSDLQAILLLGVKHRQESLYSEDFLAFAQQHPNFLFRVHYSREQDHNFLPHEHAGYIQTAFDELKPNPATDIVYLCGNPNMVDNAFEQLKALEFDIKNIRREKYIS